MAEKKSTLDERIAKAEAELLARHGPGPFDCGFCGINTKHPCNLENCMRCQNFGYYPQRAAGVEACDGCKPRRLCRDCADNDGTCPNDGKPCDPKARHTCGKYAADGVTEACHQTKSVSVPSVLPPMSEE